MNSKRRSQIKKFLTGNDAIVEAASQIDFHFMGYYPITPSTEIAERLDELRSQGVVQTVLLPADGEHGAAGACFGAATGGARVLNATSANGFLYSLEQLPVQAGARIPMVLNLVTRSVSAPLDIRCDHSDLAFALQTGWLVLTASTVQAAYDLNLFAVRLSEHPEVRVPAMVVTDGFFTSHERQSLDVFENKSDVHEFLGVRKDPFTTLDPRRPVTIGPYMNDPDLVNNKFQLHRAHEAAARVFDALAQEFEALTGRPYPRVEGYRMDDAEYALVLVNSSAETAKDAIDQARARGIKVGLLRPNLLRPFPAELFANFTRGLKGILIGERADTPGSQGGILSHEIRAICPVPARVRIYGIGGQNFSAEDATQMIEDLATRPDSPLFDFIGRREGSRDGSRELPKVLPALTREEVSPGYVRVTEELRQGVPHPVATVAHPSELALKAKRIAPGHGACPGCGIFSAIDQFFKGIEGDVVVLYHTGCAMVVTTGYPFSAHRVTYLHNLFQNGAPTLAGLVEVFHERKRRGEIQASEDITFIMVTGDGGMDIGMGPTIGTALRNHRMIILEYDNQGYMNTGGQLSYTTPLGHRTSTSHAGKDFVHKDTVAIMSATGIPYCFTAIEGFGTDLPEKAAKAQWYTRHEGLAYGKLLITCPLNWGSEEKRGQEVLQRAVDSCFFPLYEVERGKTRLTYNPEEGKGKLPISSWLEMMGKTRHLLRSPALLAIQADVDSRWERLKARHAHPLL